MLQSMGLQRVGLDLVTEKQQRGIVHIIFCFCCSMVNKFVVRRDTGRLVRRLLK